jgi:hypothetical protein
MQGSADDLRMRRPFQLVLLAVGLLVVVAYLAPGAGRPADSRRDRLVSEAGGIALSRGLDDGVRRMGASVLWGERLRIASRCEQSAPTGRVVTCKVRFDQYPNPDRWCLAHYRVLFPERSIESTRTQPFCGTYSGDGDPFPQHRSPDGPPPDRHMPPP